MTVTVELKKRIRVWDDFFNKDVFQAKKEFLYFAEDFRIKTFL